MAQEQQETQEKKMKEKVIYYDDNSTIVDMSSVNKKGEKIDGISGKIEKLYAQYKEAIAKGETADEFFNGVKKLKRSSLLLSLTSSHNSVLP